MKTGPYGVTRLSRAGKDIQNYRTPLESWKIIELEHTFHLKKSRLNPTSRFEDTLHQRSIIEAKSGSPLITLAVVCTVIVLNYS